MQADILNHLCEIVDTKTDLIAGIRDFLWHNPETMFQEFKSSDYIAKVLVSEGFEVEKTRAWS